MILFTVGGLPHCMLGYAPWADTPLGRPPGQTPPRQTPPRQTPPGRHPQADTPSRKHLVPFRYYGIRSSSGQYASYWNAFLYVVRLIRMISLQNTSEKTGSVLHLSYNINCTIQEEEIIQWVRVLQWITSCNKRFTSIAYSII